MKVKLRTRCGCEGIRNILGNPLNPPRVVEIGLLPDRPILGLNDKVSECLPFIVRLFDFCGIEEGISLYIERWPGEK